MLVTWSLLGRFGSPENPACASQGIGLNWPSSKLEDSSSSLSKSGRPDKIEKPLVGVIFPPSLVIMQSVRCKLESIFWNGTWLTTFASLIAIVWNGMTNQYYSNWKLTFSVNGCIKNSKQGYETTGLYNMNVNKCK